MASHPRLARVSLFALACLTAVPARADDTAAASLPPVVLVRPAAAFTTHWGVGVRGTGSMLSDGWNTFGGGVELLYRLTGHLVSEIAVEYQRSVADGAPRFDVPLTAGLRVHIGRPDWIVSPYFVAALGFAYGNLGLDGASDHAFYFEGQLGGGLEVRIGPHVALVADLRADGKKRLDSPSEAVLAHTTRPLGEGIGAQFRLGLAVYF